MVIYYSDPDSKIREIKNRYFNTRNEIYVELEKSGKCEAVERLIAAPIKKRISLLELCAIKEAYRRYIDGTEFRPEPDNFHSETGLSWGELSITPIDGNEYIGDLNVFSRNAWIRFSEKKKSKEDRVEAPRHVDDGFGTADSFCAEEQARKSLEDARKQAQEIREQAKLEANEILVEAKNEAKNIVADGEARRKTLLEVAEKEKQQCIKEGYAEKERIIKNVTEQQYRESLEGHIKEHFNQQALRQDQIRKNLEDEYDLLIGARSELIDTMGASAQGLQASLMLSLDDALQKMQDVQNRIHGELDSWQRTLYKNEFKEIAMCFVNLDKILLGMENRIAAELSYGEQGYHKELAAELEKHAKNLRILKNTFETSLAKNGIKLFSPDAGTSFNSYYHIAENLDPMTEDEDSLNNKPIVACKNPGLLKVTNAGDEPIFRAIVTVEK